MLSFQIILHGFLLWASMGFLMPIGILVIRMTNRHEECGTRLKIIHAISQVTNLSPFLNFCFTMIYGERVMTSFLGHDK